MSDNETSFENSFVYCNDKLKIMKKYFIVVLLISINYSYSQSESTLNLNVKSQIKEVKETDIGIFPQGKGEFIYQGVMSGSVKKTFKGVRAKVNSYAKSRNCAFLEITNSYNKRSGRVKFRFKLISGKDGSPYEIEEEKKLRIKDVQLERKEAIYELKELKGLLDLGLLTQEEFDKKAAELKKVILGN